MKTLTKTLIVIALPYFASCFGGTEVSTSLTPQVPSPSPIPIPPGDSSAVATLDINMSGAGLIEFTWNDEDYSCESTCTHTLSMGTDEMNLQIVVERMPSNTIAQDGDKCFEPNLCIVNLKKGKTSELHLEFEPFFKNSPTNTPSLEASSTERIKPQPADS